MSETNGFYARLARAVLAHRAPVAAAAVVLTVVSLVLGVPPKIDSNLLHLLPETDPVVSAIQDIDEEEGGLNLLSLAFRADDPSRLDPYLDLLQQRFEAMDTVEFAIHEVDPALALQVGMLQFEPAEIAELNVRLKGALALGSAANPFVTQRLMDMGPLTEKIAKANGIALFDDGDDRAKLLVRPRGSASDPPFAQAFMREVYALLDELRPEDHGVELTWVGGAYRHAVEDVQGIQHDLLYTTVGSLVLVLGIIAVSFRSARAILLVFPPLILANAVLFAVVRLGFGALNTYTSFGSAILFGLGIDFAIHLVGRYRELRVAGRDVDDAIARAWDLTGPPCATAALTSAAGFLALAVADFKGFAQLGVLLAVGLMVCLGAMLTLLPLLIAALDREPRTLLGALPDGEGPASTSTYRHAPVGFVAVVAATVIVGATALPRIEFEYDVSALRRDGMSYDELSEEERALAREAYSPIAVSFPTEEAMLAAQERVQGMIDAGELPHLGGVVSIGKVLPKDQAERNVQIAELVELTKHKNFRYLPPVIAKRLLPLRDLEEVRELGRDDLPEGVRHLLGARNTRVYRMLMLPKGNMWDVRESHALAAEVERALPDELRGGRVASEHIGVSRMFLLALGDTPMIAALALSLVFLLSWWDLRRPLWTVGAITTLVAGLVWSAAALVGSGVKMTLVNLSGIPILLGIGVDVVIHLLHRLREEGPGGVRRALRTTGVAAGLSTLTTVGSFLSLTLAGNRGVRSLGLLVVIGLVAVFAASATILPLVWAAGWKLTGRAPADQRPDDGPQDG